MRAPVEVTPREMFRDESLQRIIEGLKLSASCAKELNEICPKQGWGRISEYLYSHIAYCHKLSKARAISRQELLARTDRISTTQNPMVQQS